MSQRPGGEKLSPKVIANAERDLRALGLRKQGLTFESIAKRLSIGKMTAWDSVNRALKATLQEAADDVRKLEVERLDALLAAVWPQAETGDDKAVARAIQIMERRARLLGLDVPVRQELSGPGGKPLGAEVVFYLPARDPDPNGHGDDDKCD